MLVYSLSPFYQSGFFFWIEHLISMHVLVQSFSILGKYHIVYIDMLNKVH